VEESGGKWSSVVLPANLAIVGTVNMDESSHGFSRKVLDRAFTLEFSDVHLDDWGVDTNGASDGVINLPPWASSDWFPRATSLGALGGLREEELEEVRRSVQALTEINKFLIQAQLQVGYRTRDEVALFSLQAHKLAHCFVTAQGHRVDPLDLAVHMKVLPRIIGGSGSVRRVVLQFLGWARSGVPLELESDAGPILDEWEAQGRAEALENARFPRTAARLCLMWERLSTDGFTSFWL
jgi:hypothetical protein